MSSTVAEEVRPREITHQIDRPFLGSMGADLKDPVLLAEYFEYRELYGRHGELPLGTLLELRYRQKRRQAKETESVAPSKNGKKQ